MIDESTASDPLHLKRRYKAFLEKRDFYVLAKRFKRKKNIEEKKINRNTRKVVFSAEIYKLPKCFLD